MHSELRHVFSAHACFYVQANADVYLLLNCSLNKEIFATYPGFVSLAKQSVTPVRRVRE